MTANVGLSPVPKERFVDSSGNALVGGKVFTYAAGTTAKQASYMDAGGVNTNTNPIILDGRGEANIWLDNTLAYKFVLAPATDTDPPTAPIWTIDNIPAAGSPLAALVASLATAAGSTEIGWQQSGGTLTTVDAKLKRQMVSPKDFGGVGDGVAYDDVAINLAAAACRTLNLYLDLTGAVSWRIRNRLVLTNVPGVLAHALSPILPEITGTYTNGYVIEIGDPSGNDTTGRSNFFVLLGTLQISVASRATALNGVYIKGSLMNVGHIVALGFNGTGICLNSVWDSTFARLCTELCGNATTYSMVITALLNGDSNCTHIGSVQCEQAYQHGLNINAIRYVIDNIHSERLAIISANDGTPILLYLNHLIILSNSSVHQALFDCLTSGTAPDGSALAATSMHLRLNGQNVTWADFAVTGSIWCDYGLYANFDELTASGDFTQNSPAAFTTLNGGNIAGTLYCGYQMQMNQVAIGTFNYNFNCANVQVNGGTIGAHILGSGIRGSIEFNGVIFAGAMGDTGANSPGFTATAFNNCYIPTFNGAFNGFCRVNGGSIGTVALVSQSQAVFDNVDIGSGGFTYAGNSGFLTWNCRCAGAVGAWTTPNNVNWPAGTRTMRIGYMAGMTNIYVNNNGTTGWAAIA